MLIISQDMSKTTTDLNLYIETPFRNYFCIINKHVGSLGRYSTKEKAINVLDKLAEAYQKDAYRGYEVFKMPADDEV